MTLRGPVIGLFALFATLAAFACTSFSSDPADPSMDASVEAGAADADADADTAVDVEPDDAGPALAPIDDLDGGVDAAVDGCVPVLPIKVVTVPGAIDAVVCNSSNVLVSDGRSVGLDLKVGGVAKKIGGATITSCVGVDFGAPIQKAFIKLRAVGSACGIPCNGACGTGDTAKLFAGDTATGLVYLSGAAAATTLKTFAVPIPAGNTGRFVAVCRGGFAAAADDFEVDSIVGCR